MITCSISPTHTKRQQDLRQNGSTTVKKGSRRRKSVTGGGWWWRTSSKLSAFQSILKQNSKEDEESKPIVQFHANHEQDKNRRKTNLRFRDLQFLFEEKPRRKETRPEEPPSLRLLRAPSRNPSMETMLGFNRVGLA